MIIDEEFNSTQVGTFVFDFLLFLSSVHLSQYIQIHSFTSPSLHIHLMLQSTCILHFIYHYKPSKDNPFQKTIKKKEDLNFLFVKQVQNYRVCFKFHIRTVQYCL